MDDDAIVPTAPRKKNLLSPAKLARGARIGREPDLTRSHGQGNGVRVHGIYFALLSLAVLAVFIVAIAFASAMM